MLSIENLIILFSFAFVGGCIGSFINVIVYRLPKMMNYQWLGDCIIFLREYLEELKTDPTILNQTKDINQNPNSIIDPNKEAKSQSHTITELINKLEDSLIEANPKNFNLLTPRSHCPNCKTMIPFYRNIPVVTWIWQHGTANCCKTPISVRYFIIELLAVGLSIAGLLAFDFSLQGIISVLFLLTLLALAAIDYETRLLPDTITIPLIWIGLLINIFDTFTDINSAIYGAVIGYLFLWILYYCHKWITKREGLGFGDFKLTAAFGAWFGYQAIPIILVIAALIGLNYALFSSRLRNNFRSEILAFGPSLCSSAVIFMFFGQEIKALIGL